MDRQDIDALLIGALYGELTLADEARLAAHLDSHPGDRGALDDLKSARQAVRESRIFEVQLDPPQAVSALLLQEAHRRAPKRVVRDDEKEGWFARFTRAFMAHPAMAAAAMLVLVVGVAGTVYMKRGDHLATKEVSGPQLSQVTSTPADQGAAAPVATPSAPSAESTTAAGSAYQVGLADAEAKVAAPEPQSKLEKKQTDDLRQRKQATRGIVVGTKGASPKDLDSKNDGFGFEEGRSAPSGGGAAAMPSTQPPPAVTTAPAKRSEAPTVDSTSSMDASLLAWAKQRHSAAIAATRAGDCGRAATIAIEIGNKAPDYYATKMADDRDLKSCQQYIVQKRNEEAEQKQKSRASKRVNADESYEPPSPSAK